MEGTVSGHHKSPHRGSSVEFAEYRNYVPGDDIRRLDWRVFGRTDRFYMKEFEAETNLRCYLVLDCSGSMRLPEKHGSASSILRDGLLATLAYLVDSSRRRRRFDLCDGENRSRSSAHAAIRLTCKPSSRLWKKPNQRGETGLIAALHELAEKVRRRALVIIFSDFFCEPNELLSCFQHLRFQKHDLAVFHLLDRDGDGFQVRSAGAVC